MQFSKLFLRFSLVSILFTSSFLTSGCSSKMGTGGVFGTLVGAGTGALVGAALSRGDVVASALLGGAIGLPIGLAIGYHLQKSDEEAVEQAKIEKYIDNQQGIIRREREIESLREEVMRDSPDSEPDDADAIYIYKGATLGNPSR